MTKKGLSIKQQGDLKKSINEFNDWLFKKKILLNKFTLTKIILI